MAFYAFCTGCGEMNLVRPVLMPPGQVQQYVGTCHATHVHSEEATFFIAPPPEVK